MNGFDDLRDRVEAITKLNKRACQIIATSLLQDAPADMAFSAGQIVKEAERLGYEFDRPEGVQVDDDTAERAFDAEVTMDPGMVQASVYEVSPRAFCTELPRLGQAPDELRELAPELVEQLPDEVKAMLVKLDVFEGKATFWVYDEANEIDRAIGPIDLSRFTSAEALAEAFYTLARRLGRVLAAEFN